jgi:hypothetical protein
MIRARLAAPALLVLLAATAPPANAQPVVDFGTAELGEIRTACFTACFGQDCQGSGTVSSLSVGAPFFVRGIRTAPSDSNPCNTANVSTPRTLPVNISPNQFLVWDVDLVPTATGSFQDLLDVNGTPQFDLQADVDPVTGCTATANAACLQADRFKTRVHWRTEFGTRGAGPVVPASSASDDSGLFYFFSADNWEVLLKVLNACSTTQPRFWVFAAATTNVEYTITVTDTEEQEVATYFKPQGPPAPAITDTTAFATCP